MHRLLSDARIAKLSILEGDRKIFSTRLSAINRESSSGSSIESQTRLLYYAGLCVVIANRVLDQVADNMGMPLLSSPIVMVLGIMLLCARVCFVSLHCRLLHVLPATAMVILSFISWVNSGQSYLLLAVLLLLGVGRIDTKKLVRQCSMAILVIVALLGILQVLQLIIYGVASGSAIRADGRIRLSFFFRHPNMLAAYTTMAYIGFTMGAKAFRGGSATFGMMLVVLCVYVTDSRTAAAVMIVYIVLRLLSSTGPFRGRVARGVFACIPILLMLAVIIVSMSTTSDVLYGVLQRVLSGRPGFWRLQYELLGGFTLFGQHALSGTIVVNGWTYSNVTIDSFYAGSLLSLGAWALPAFYLLYLRTGKAAFDKGESGVVIALFCCALYGFTEIQVADLAVSLPMLLLGSNLFIPQNYSTSSKGYFC